MQKQHAGNRKREGAASPQRDKDNEKTVTEMAEVHFEGDGETLAGKPQGVSWFTRRKPFCQAGPKKSKGPIMKTWFPFPSLPRPGETRTYVRGGCTGHEEMQRLHLVFLL